MPAATAIVRRVIGTRKRRTGFTALANAPATNPSSSASSSLAAWNIGAVAATGGGVMTGPACFFAGAAAIVGAADGEAVFGSAASAGAPALGLRGARAPRPPEKGRAAVAGAVG